MYLTVLSTRDLVLTRKGFNKRTRTREREISKAIMSSHPSHGSDDGSNKVEDQATELDTKEITGVEKHPMGDDEEVAISSRTEMATNEEEEESAVRKNQPESSSANAAAAASKSIAKSNAKSIAKSSVKIEAFEIEMGRTVSGISEEDLDELMEHGNVASIRNSDHQGALVTARSEEEEGDDMESLLDKNSKKTKRSSILETSSEKGGMWCLPCCAEREPLTRMGNIHIVFPRLYATAGGLGVSGPHWFGPPCVVGIILFASYYFIYECSWKKNLYMTSATCTVLCITTLYNLINAAYRDPGVIVKGGLALPDPVPRSYRWCETCNYFQPPTAAHCPDCNVCVAGFDHHCVWMSLCIGQNNFKHFVRFNLSWLAYLMYAIVWVSIVAPLMQQ